MSQDRFTPGPGTGDGNPGPLVSFAEAAVSIVHSGDNVTGFQLLGPGKLFEQLRTGETAMVSCTEAEVVNMVGEESGMLLPPDLLYRLGLNNLQWTFLYNPNAKDLVFCGFVPYQIEASSTDPKDAQGTVFVKRVLKYSQDGPVPDQIVFVSGLGNRIVPDDRNSNGSELQLVTSEVSLAGNLDTVSIATYRAGDRQLDALGIELSSLDMQMLGGGVFDARGQEVPTDFWVDWNDSARLQVVITRGMMSNNMRGPFVPMAIARRRNHSGEPDYFLVGREIGERSKRAYLTYYSVNVVRRGGSEVPYVELECIPGNGGLASYRKVLSLPFELPAYQASG